jgi:putative endonuclease
MGRNRMHTGRWGEALAERFLIGRGDAVLARNWRPPWPARGELDLVLQRGDVIVFVEVRARHGLAFGAPEETVTPRKRARLIEAAQAYLDAHNLSALAWQIDFVAIEFDARNRVTRLAVIEHAIG